MDTAEVLIAERGYDGTSLRDIASMATVNLGAVNYHFRSKRGLLKAVLKRRGDALNLTWLRSLEALESEASSSLLPIEKVLHALLEPLFLMKATGGRHCLRIMARAQVEPGLFPDVLDLFAPTLDRFQRLIGRTLPGCCSGDLLWRMRLAIGAVCHAILCPTAVEGAGVTVVQVVAFLRAGFHACVPAKSDLDL